MPPYERLGTAVEVVVAHQKRDDYARIEIDAQRHSSSRMREISSAAFSFGRLRPEMDAFAWIDFAEVHDRCAKNMALVLTQRLSLPALLKRLSGSAPVRPDIFAPVRT